MSACDFSVYDLPLPGGADVGDDPITVTVEFADVLDLVPKSAVKVNDVTVGQVSDVRLKGYTAEVTLELRKDTELPDNALAQIRQTSLLGEKFVSLSAPAEGAQGRLSDGDDIPLDRSGRNPEVEEVLGALSLILNGGGIAQAQSIVKEVNKVLTGREDDVRSLLDQVDTFTGTLDDNKGDIVDAIEALNRLSISVRQQQDKIDLALDELPSALTSIDGQRRDLVKMLKALDQLSDVGVRVINASKDATIGSLQQLQPVLAQLANSGDDFVNAFNVFLTYPFVDEAVGRDPQVARNLHMGDYTNLSVQLQLDLTQGLPTLPGLPTEVVCTPLGQIPDVGPLPPLDTLCAGAIDAINKCLQSPSLQNCQGLPNFLISQVCQQVAIPVLCPGAGSATPGVPLPTLPSITLPSISLPGLPLTSNGLLGGTLNGLGLNRAAPGTGTQVDARGPTMAQLQEVYDPDLVNLLVPQMVTGSGQQQSGQGSKGARQ
nr:MCE family protein [Nocardioides flavescens]